MSQRHRALIVEDEHEAAADLAQILETCGCDCVVVTNRRDALLQLEATTFCIVLLDLEIGSEPDSNLIYQLIAIALLGCLPLVLLLRRPKGHVEVEVASE